MVTTGRIDISGQFGMCDTSEVSISRSMPAVLEGKYSVMRLCAFDMNIFFIVLY